MDSQRQQEWYVGKRRVRAKLQRIIRLMHGRLRMIRAAYLRCLSLRPIFSFTLSPRQRNHLTCNQSWENILNREFDQYRLIHRGWWSIFSFWITIFERYRKEMSFFKKNFLGNFDGIKWKIFYDIVSLCKEFVRFFFFFFLNAKRNERCVFLHVRCTNPYFAGDKDWNYECVKR